MTQPTLLNFFKKPPSSSPSLPPQPPPPSSEDTIQPTPSTAPSQESTPLPKPSRCAICARTSSDLICCTQCSKNFHSKCHAPEISCASSFVCCVCDASRAPKRPRLSAPDPLRRAKIEDIDTKIPDMFLRKEQKELRKRLKREKELKQLSLDRNKELAAIVGVSDDRKICPIFLKPADRPLLPSSIASVLAPVLGSDPIFDFKHYNPPYASLHSLPALPLFECLHDSLSVMEEHPRYVQRRETGIVGDFVWPRSAELEVDRKQLRRLTEAARGREPGEDVKTWLELRLDENKEETKQVGKFLKAWKSRKGKSALLVISGPSGCGKTTLVEAATKEADYAMLEIWEMSDLQISEEALYSKNVTCTNNNQVIVINDLDVLIANDRAIANQFAHYIDGAKRPVIVTTSSNLPDSIASLAKEVLHIDAPLIEAVALTTAHRTGVALPRALALAREMGRNFRFVLLNAQTLAHDGVVEDPLEFSGLAISRSLAEGRMLDSEIVDEVFGGMSEYLDFAFTLGADSRNLAWLDRKNIGNLENLFPGLLLPNEDFSQTALSREEVFQRRASMNANLAGLKDMVQSVSGPRDWLRTRWDRHAVPEIVGALSLAATADSLTSQRRRQCLFGTSFDFRALQLYPKIR